MSSLTDAQISGLLDIVIAQENDIHILKSYVFALSKIANAETAGEAAELIPQYVKEFEKTTPSHGPFVQLLESMSLQLKQSGQPIQ